MTWYWKDLKILTLLQFLSTSYVIRSRVHTRFRGKSLQLPPLKLKQFLLILILQNSLLKWVNGDPNSFPLHHGPNWMQVTRSDCVVPRLGLTPCLPKGPLAVVQSRKTAVVFHLATVTTHHTHRIYIFPAASSRLWKMPVESSGVPHYNDRPQSNEDVVWWRFMVVTVLRWMVVVFWILGIIYITIHWDTSTYWRLFQWLHSEVTRSQREVS